MSLREHAFSRKEFNKSKAISQVFELQLTKDISRVI